MADITKEINFYKKHFLKLNEHYRLKPISSYMSDFNQTVHIQYGFPYAYICLNEPNNYIRLIRENEANELIVGEAEIKTYPVNKAYLACKKFCKENLKTELYSLNISDTEIEKIHDNAIVDCYDEYIEIKKVENRWWFSFPFYTKDNLKHFVGQLNDKMYTYGYNFSSLQQYHVAKQPFYSNIEIVVIMFEAKYLEEDFKWSKTLYHVTTMTKIKKIKQHGLVQYSKSARFEYPERVYLFNNANMDVIFNYVESKCRHLSDYETAVILKIDSNKLINSTLFKNGKMKFYIDHMFEDYDVKGNALFTYDVVRKDLLEDDVLLLDVEDGKIINFRSAKLSEI